MSGSWQSFDSLAQAERSVRGYTAEALRVVVENMPVREQVDLIATGAVTDAFGDTFEGVVVLSDAAIYIGHADTTMNQAFASWVDRRDASALERLRDRGNLAVFRTDGFSTSNLQLSPASAQLLEHALYGPAPVQSAPAPTPAQPAPAPTPAQVPPPVATTEPRTESPPIPPEAPSSPVTGRAEAAPVEPPPAQTSPSEPVEVWVGAKTKEKFLKKATPLLELNLRPNEVVQAIAEVNTEILAITNQRAFTLKTYGDPIPLVSVLGEEIVDVSLEGSATKIIVRTIAGQSVQLCKTYTKDDVPTIVKMIKELAPATGTAPSAPQETAASDSAPAPDIKCWGKFKDKAYQEALGFINANMLPGEHVRAMLNNISRWVVVTNQRVLEMKTVAPKKFEEATLLSQIASATLVDNFASSTPVLETKSGMRVELRKGSDREGMSFIVGEIQLALKGLP